MASHGLLPADQRQCFRARAPVRRPISAFRLHLVLLVVLLMGCAGGRTAGTDDPGDASVDSGANVSWQTVSAPLAILTAQRLVAADPALKAMLASAQKGWERDGAAATSSGWRATADKKFDQLSARLGERANARFDVGLGRFERFGLRITREGASASSLELHEGRGVYSDAYRSTDVVVVANGFRYEELLVLRDSSAPAEFAWLVELPRGLHGPRREASGALVFDDAKGEGVLRIPAAYSIDASGVKRAVEFDWQGGRLAVRPDLRGVVWPVAVDPAIETAVWEDRSPAPYGEYSSAMAYDNARGRTVLFGGQYSPSYALVRDTWEWDGSTWMHRATTGPSARSGAAMAYDSARGRVVLFGGHDDTDFLGDTWEWDGSNWMQKTTTGPIARYGHAMSYDSVRGRTVLYGGLSDLGDQGDTWEWDGSSWTKVATTGPSKRDSHAMAYDSVRNRTVLFGGTAGGAETWEWDGTTWTLKATTGPSARVGHALAYDSPRGRTVLFGGSAGAAETWEWDGTNWTLKATTGPSQRQAHVMAYDGLHERTVLFGGRASNGDSLGDTWEWDGTIWTQETTPASAFARAGHALAYDSVRQRTVLFGGSAWDRLGDTWEWDGTTWTTMATVGPPPRAVGALAYDSARGRTVLFGGQLQYGDPDTWEWDGMVWTQMATTGPSARYGNAMAYDSVDGRIILFGGMAEPGSVLLGDTWERDGTTWTKVATTGPSARYGHAMAYDSARGRTVLFGGVDSNILGDTWEWDGTSWTQLATTGPGARDKLAMAYDSARERIVLFGGQGPSDYPGDTWEWDGSVWTQLATTGPNPRWYVAMAYDNARRRTVLFGGGYYGCYGDTWEYHTHGGSCSNDSSCDTGHCVDGVCCEQSACPGTCQACNATTPGVCSTTLANEQDPDTCTGSMACSASGACKKKMGQSCSAVLECASGFCVDGYCCVSACDGGCDACDVTPGVCTLAASGDPGANPSCAPFVCTGMSQCPTECAIDANCAANRYCATDGSCQLRKGQASECDLTADCKSQGCRECDVGLSCADHVCCDQPCDGLCEACVASKKGSGTDGSCGPTKADADPDNECQDDGSPSCGLNGYCDGHGACAQYAGTGCTPVPCTDPAECASGFCADGVCCDTDCSGACEACTAATKGAGPNGLCAAVADGTDPDNDCEPEQGFPESCQADGMCNGTGACRKYAAEGTVCGDFSCSGGEASGYACNGAGSCGTATVACFPFVCADSSSCFMSCSKDADCVSGYTCKGQACVPPTGATCDGEHTLVGADGNDQDCSPYKCSLANVCMTACTSRADCVDTAACSTDGRCQPSIQAPAAASDTGCGCRTAGQRGGAGGLGAAMLLFAGSLICARRRTKRPGRKRGAVVIRRECVRSARRPNP